MNTHVPVVLPPLEGEIITPSDKGLRIFFAPHPFQHRTLRWELPAGDTIREIIRECITRYLNQPVVEGGSVPRPLKVDDFTCLLGEGNPIPQEVWERVRPKPGVTLVLRPVPGPPLVPLIAGISAAFAGISTFIAGLGFFGKLLWAGIMFGLKFLLNKLFAPKEPDPTIESTDPAYSITASRNEADQFGTIPVILGKHRVVPLYGGLPYTEIVGNDQYLRALFIVGYGPLEITDIRIGETPIAQYDDILIQTKKGYASDANPTLYPKEVIEETLSIKLTVEDGWQMRTTAENITSFSVDFFWPQGLYWRHEAGTYFNMGTALTVQYRKKGTSSWKAGPRFTFQGIFIDPIRRSATVGGLNGQYEVRVLNSTPTPIPGSNIQVACEVHWTALRGMNPGEAVTFPDPIAMIAIRIRATDQLNGVIDTLNCVASSRVVAYNLSTHTWQSNIESNWPPDLFRWVLTCVANKRPVPLARIDLVALQTWKSYCVSQGFRYNRPIDAAASVLDILLEICACGRASPVFKDGKWSVIWDEQAMPIAQMFTPRNSWGFEATQQYFEMPHAFRCKFINAAKGWIADEVMAYDDGRNKGNSTKFEQFEFPGVTDKNQMWKMGRFNIAQLRLRPAIYTLFCDWEGMALVRNDRVRVQHDVMLIGLYSGRVKSRLTSPDRVVLDETVMFDAGKAYSFIFRQDNGVFLTRVVAGGLDGEFTTVTLSGVGSLPPEGCLFTCGLSGKETSDFRILGIEPQEDMVHRMTLVDDAPLISRADTGTIPDYVSNITKPYNPFTMKPAGIKLSATAYAEGTQFYARLHIMWEFTRVGQTDWVEIQYRNETDKVWRAVGTYKVTIVSTDVNRLGEAKYTARARSHFTDKTYSAWTQSAILDATKILDPPANVENFRITTLGDLSTLTWDKVAGVGVTYNIRFAGSAVTTPAWGNSTPMATDVGLTSVQVPTRIGSYLIKAVLPSLLTSVNEAIIKTDIAALAGINYITTIVDDTPWSGTHTSTQVVADEVQLTIKSVMALWDNLAAVSTLVSGDGGPDTLGYVTQGSYQLPGWFDLGGVYTSKITASVDAYGIAYTDIMSYWNPLANVAVLDSQTSDKWEIWLEHRITLVDPAVGPWQGWSRVIAGEATFRAIQFRVVLQGMPLGMPPDLYSGTTPSLKSVSVDVDMPERIISANDVSAAAGGTAIVWTQAFRGPSAPSGPAIAISAQGLATGDFYAITAKSVTGFTIQFKNSAGTGVARTFDYVAKGYGNKI